ncbi:MAG: TolC family protein [Myxococcaceae bacterium]
MNTLLQVTLCALAGASPLSLEEALQRSEQVSPLVRRARADRAQAEAARVGAAIVLPSNPIAGAWAGAGSEAGRSGAEGGVRLEQQVEIFGQRGTRLREVDARVEAAQTLERVALQETRARVRAAFAAAQLSEVRVQDAAERWSVANTFASALEVRLKAGAIAESDVLLAKAEVGRATAEREETRLEASLALSELGRWVREASSAPVAVSAAAEAPPAPVGAPGDWLSRARSARADRLALQRHQTALAATLDRLSREALPSPAFFVEWQRSVPAQGFGLIGGLSIPLPFVHRNQGERALVEAEQRRLELETQLFDRQLELELEAASSAYFGLLQQWRAFHDEVLPQLDAALEAAERGAASGKYDVFRVLQLRRERAVAIAELRRLLGEAWRARVELDRLMGDA